MANCLKAFSLNVAICSFVASAMVSIAISGWQYTSSANGNTWYADDDGKAVDFVKDICDAWPYQYMRPFSVKCKNCDNPSYCGYSDASTGYRIGIACFTGILAILMAFKKFDGQPLAFWIILLLNTLFWGAAFVIDCAIVSNAALACSNSDSWGSGEECNNSKYGITIAIDLVLVVVTSIAWLALAGLSPTGEQGATSGSGGTATASGSDASKSYTFGGSSLTTYSDQL